MEFNMAIQDFTKYLGAQVRFRQKLPGDLVVTLDGVITEVLIKQDLQDSEFVLDNEFYYFNAVEFITKSLVSAELS